MRVRWTEELKTNIYCSSTSKYKGLCSTQTFCHLNAHYFSTEKKSTLFSIRFVYLFLFIVQQYVQLCCITLLFVLLTAKDTLNTWLAKAREYFHKNHFYPWIRSITISQIIMQRKHYSWSWLSWSPTICLWWWWVQGCILVRWDITNQSKSHSKF